MKLSIFVYCGLFINLVSVASYDNSNGLFISNYSSFPNDLENRPDQNVVIPNDIVPQKDRTRSLLSLKERISIIGKIKAHRSINNDNSLSSGRNDLWQTVWPTLNNYKTESSLWSVGSDGSPIFDKYHLIAVPVWWDGDYEITEQYSVEIVTEVCHKRNCIIKK